MAMVMKINKIMMTATIPKDEQNEQVKHKGKKSSSLRYKSLMVQVNDPRLSTCLRNV